jgi:hypothetical protein
VIRTPHRTKGPGVLGAQGPGQAGPFGRWPDGTEDDETDTPGDTQASPRTPDVKVRG